MSTPPGGPHPQGNGWGRFDEESSGDAGRPSAERPFSTFAYGDVTTAVTWVGLLVGAVLTVWGGVWLAVGRPLGWVPLLLGIVMVVGSVHPILRRRRAR